MADADIRTMESEDGSWAQTGKDLGSGAAGGIAQVLIGKSNTTSGTMVSNDVYMCLLDNTTVDVEAVEK